MSSASPEILPVGDCTAARLRRFADGVMNAGAIREAAAATDELHAPGDEPEEYVVYLDDTPLDFEPRTEDCARCHFAAKLSHEGKVTPSYQCDVTDTCVLTTMRMHPEKYRNPDGSLSSERQQCGAYDCSAVARPALADDGTLIPSVTHGQCTVDSRKDTWEDTYAEAVGRMESGQPTTQMVDDSRPI